MQILDIDYFLKDGRPVIRIFGKKPNGQTVCAMHEGIRPYFYCEYNEKAAEKIEELGLEFEIVDRKSAIGYAVEPQKFCKVYTVTPSEVPDVRMSLSPFTKCYEADILFTYRYMVDSGIGGMKWVAIEGDVVKTTLTKSGIETYLIRSTEPIENIENLDSIVEKAGAIEKERDKLAYGKQIPEKDLTEKINIFLELKKEVENV